MGHRGKGRASDVRLARMRDPPSNTVRRTAAGGRLTQTVLDFVERAAA